MEDHLMISKEAMGSTALALLAETHEQHLVRSMHNNAMASVAMTVVAS